MSGRGGGPRRGSGPRLAAEARGGQTDGFPQSVLLVQVFGDRIEVNEQFSHQGTEALIEAMRRFGVGGRVSFRTPCG